MNKKYIILLLGFQALMSAYGQTAFPELRGSYLGQEVPGTNAPKLFAPGVISTGLNERDVAVDEAQSVLFYSIFYNFSPTMWITENKGKWTEPRILEFQFGNNYAFIEPALSHDGRHLYCLTTHPIEGERDKPGWGNQNIFVSHLNENGQWEAPVDLGPSINTVENEYFPSLTADNTLYFTRSVARSHDTQLFRVRQVNGKWGEAEALPEVINTDKACYNACIAPDESYLLSCVSAKGRFKENKSSRFYLFIRNKNDQWSEPIRLDERFNFPDPISDAISINISGDGRYIFFSTSRIGEQFNKEHLTFDDYKAMPLSPENGEPDIYWIDAKVIGEYR